RGALGHDRGRGRGNADRGARNRVVDRARVPARGSRPTGRLSLGRPRAPARDATSVRLRPPPDRRRSGSGVGPLAAVSEPCSQLSVRVRIRRATVTDSVGIIGAGLLGQAVARTALRAGRHVVIANSRGPESLASVVSELGGGVSAGTVEQASAVGIVVIAVPWDRVPEAVQGIDWDGQVVIDATNDWGADDLNGRTSSELVADLVAGARVVKAANTLGAEVL